MFKVFAFLLFLVVTSKGVGAGIISVIGPISSPEVGNTFGVAVEATDVMDLYAFQFDLSFNPKVVAVDSVTEGLFLPSSATTLFIPGTIDNVAGIISANADTLIGNVPGASGDGSLAEFQFTALASGATALSFGNPILLDSSLNDITSGTTFQSGSATIGGIASVPEPQFSALFAAGLILLILIRELMTG